MNENPSEPIGGPDPIKPRQAGAIFDVVVGALTLTLGTVAALVLFAVPTRTAGATRSAKLRWQQRQNEIRQSIENNDANQVRESASKKDESQSDMRP